MMERTKLKSIFGHRKRRPRTHECRKSWVFSLLGWRRGRRSKQQEQGGECPTSAVSLPSPPSPLDMKREKSDESTSCSTQTEIETAALDHFDSATVESSFETEDPLVLCNEEDTRNGVLNTQKDEALSSPLLLENSPNENVEGLETVKRKEIQGDGKQCLHGFQPTCRLRGTSQWVEAGEGTVNCLQQGNKKDKFEDADSYYDNENVECATGGSLFSGKIRFLEEEIVFFSERNDSGGAEISVTVRLSFDHTMGESKEEDLGLPEVERNAKFGPGDAEETSSSLDRKRRLCFADEIGLPLVELHMIGGNDDPYATSRIVVLVLDPSVKKFEIMQGEYSVHAGPTVNDLLLQLPNFANQERFSKMEYTSLIGTYKSIREFSSSDRLFDLELVKREVTVAVPKGANATELMSAAAPILMNTNIMKSIKRATRVSRGLKYIKSGDEMKNDLGFSSNFDLNWNLMEGFSWTKSLTKPPSMALVGSKTVWASRSSYHDDNHQDAHEMNKFIHATMFATIGLVLSFATISS